MYWKATWSDPRQERHRGGDKLLAWLGVEEILDLIVCLPDSLGDGVVLWLCQLPHPQVSRHLGVTEHHPSGPHRTPVLA